MNWSWCSLSKKSFWSGSPLNSSSGHFSSRHTSGNEDHEFLSSRSALTLLEAAAFDMDPGLQDWVLWLQYINTHGLQKSCGGKGMVWPLSK